MSVLYRALWLDEVAEEPAAYIERVRAQFSLWATEDPLRGSLPDGEVVCELPPNRHRTITCRSVSGALAQAGQVFSASGFEGVTHDAVADLLGTQTMWTTVVRAAVDEASVHVWVENRMESDELSRPVKIGRPRIVDALLGLTKAPHLGKSVLQVDAQTVHRGEVSTLVEELRSADRTLPVIVFTQPQDQSSSRWRTRADRVARRVGGIARVIILDSNAVPTFRVELGRLATWGGGVRIYAPSPMEDASDERRHKYVPGHLMASREDAMIDRIVRLVAQMSTRRRTGEIFQCFTSTAPAGDPLVRLGLTEEALEEERLDRELEQMRAQDDLDAVHQELNRALGHLDRFRRRLEEVGQVSIFWETQSDGDIGVPDEVQDIEEAILSAQTYLAEWLVIHEGAPRELDGLNTGPQSVAWGNTTWRGFRALSAFAEDRSQGYEGNFYAWCESGPPLGWPATSKKLSMTESGTVQDNNKMATARWLPVSREVHDGGKIHMWSHLKIAEGGGDLAPRVYFHDDTSGSTGKIHVGFIGPHFLMPNTKS